MSPEDKSAQYLDLNANERLLEIQAEIVAIEKKRIQDHISPEQKTELGEKIKFLVSEEKLILEHRYKKQRDIKKAEETSGTKEESKSVIKEIIDSEIAGNKKIEGELKQIIQATRTRMWYETWWGKLVIIIVGAVLVSLMGDQTINLSELIS